MKKQMMIVMALILALVNILPAVASEKNLDLELEGYVLELLEDGFLMADKELGEVVINVSDATVFDGFLVEEPVRVYDYVIVQYDGKQTRSIPAQAHADVVSMYYVSGMVAEVMEDDSFLLTGDFIHGDVLVKVTEDMPMVAAGSPVTVFFDGIMTMSLPGQITARKIVLPEVCGMIEEIAEEGFTLTTDDGQSIAVIYGEETLLDEMVMPSETIMDAEVAPIEELQEGDAFVQVEESDEVAEIVLEEENEEAPIVAEAGMKAYLYDVELVQQEEAEDETICVVAGYIVLAK